MNHSSTLSREILAAPESIYRAFTTPSGLLDWCANAVELDAANGRYLFLWTETGYRLTGEIGDCVENESIYWQIHSPAPGSIAVSIRPAEEGAQVSLKLSGEDSAEPHLKFWNQALDNLKSVLETGLDRRVYDRPMLGILIGGLLDEDHQARYDVPVSYGIIVNGTVTGMGPEDLGLMEEDILCEMEGVELTDYQALSDVISRFKAGERVNVTWYRGPVRHNGRLRLSGRPVPFTPTTPQELSEYLEGVYDRLDAELAEILDGVSEEAAAYRPMDTEWTAHEIIAHVIATERAAQLWVAKVLRGEMLPEWATNDPAVVRSIVDVYPTLPEIVAELRRTEAQTVALIRHLPPEIVNHRGTYMKIVTELGEHGLPLHTRMHYDTIRTQVEAAQRAALQMSR